MTWQAPWVWAGIAVIALPVLIHLLGQGKAKRLPFPTLQFFGAARPLPTQRTRLHDLLLLAVRIGILAAAVAALARPLLLTASRHETFNESLARAIVVDTSTSMPRTDAALANARQLADSVDNGILLRTSRPRDAIAGAVAWLRRQPGRGEVVLVSDFQAGTIDSIDVAAIPADIGVRTIRVARDSDSAPVTTHLNLGLQHVTATVTRSGPRSEIDWSPGQATPDSAPRLTILAGPDEKAQADAALRAATTLGSYASVAPNRRIAIVFPRAPERTALLRDTTSLAPWMAEVLPSLPLDSGGVAVAGNVAGEPTLIVAPNVDPGSLAAATLIVSARRALSVAVSVTELDPAINPETVVAGWQRAPSARTGPAPESDISDGRWFWILALVLLGVETLVRRTVKSPAVFSVDT